METPDVPSVLHAAEHAAAAGDYASAEQLLREAASVQEAELGPLHPDLANTLNNLGVVCDIRENVDAAESFYRRAYAIANAALDPDHPFVATSRKNLADFCAARGKALEPPPAPRAPEPGIPQQPDPVTTAVAPVSPPERQPQAADPGHGDPQASRRGTPAINLLRDQPAPGSARRSSRRVAIGLLGTVGLVFLLIAASRAWFGSSATAPGPVAIDNAPAPKSDEPEDRPATEPAPPSAPSEKPMRHATSETIGNSVAASTGARLPTAEARLCRNFSSGSERGGWQCDSPGAPVRPGPLVFYTRIKSATDTTVQHRWYRDDQLRKVVDLHIRANPTEGYRTFSRNTINGGSAGNWKVELRSKDGELLHEERFVVR